MINFRKIKQSMINKNLIVSFLFLIKMKSGVKSRLKCFALRKIFIKKKIYFRLINKKLI